LEAKISNLESKLQEANKSGKKTEIENLERELQNLKDQQKKNLANKESQNLSPKNSY